MSFSSLTFNHENSENYSRQRRVSESAISSASKDSMLKTSTCTSHSRIFSIPVKRAHSPSRKMDISFITNDFTHQQSPRAPRPLSPLDLSDFNLWQQAAVTPTDFSDSSQLSDRSATSSPDLSHNRIATTAHTCPDNYSTTHQDNNHNDDGGHQYNKHNDDGSHQCVVHNRFLEPVYIGPIPARKRNFYQRNTYLEQGPTPSLDPSNSAGHLICRYDGCDTTIVKQHKVALAHISDVHNLTSTRRKANSSTSVPCLWENCNKLLNPQCLRRHVVTSHLKTVVLVCERCGRSFSRVDAERRHRMTCCVCVVCGSSYRDKQQLAKHPCRRWPISSETLG